MKWRETKGIGIKLKMSKMRATKAVKIFAELLNKGE